MNELIAVVDDEEDITSLIAVNLVKSGFRVQEFHEGGRLIESIKKQVPDLLILDLMLPDIDGLDLCKMLRKNERTESMPIIMLTARAEETDRVLGLELGADDYIVKPFSPKELAARVKAVLRRKDRQEEGGQFIVNGFLKIDPQQYLVSVDDRPVQLTTTEFKILHLLASKPGWVYSREAILDHLWGREKYVLDRTIDVHIRHLRSKLGERGDVIKNVRGVGYKLEV
jgi:two-component system phosphate regulon response regulator PhoB/two-component system alkaline phosphatase synthesis response regulator PhoP